MVQSIGFLAYNLNLNFRKGVERRKTGQPETYFVSKKKDNPNDKLMLINKIVEVALFEKTSTVLHLEIQ
jgi:hypothetical protein